MCENIAKVEEFILPGPSKNTRGKPIGNQQRQMAYNIFKQNKNQGHSKTQSVMFTAATTGISERTIFSILKEMETTGKIVTPNITRRRKDMTEKLDDEQKKALWSHIHSFFLKNEPPTITKVMELVQKDESLPRMSRATLHRLLTELGFIWKKKAGSSIKVSEEDVGQESEPEVEDQKNVDE